MRRLREVALAIGMSAACMAQAWATTRTVLILDAGDEPMLSLRIGHAAQHAWSPDLLGFNQAIEVSSGVEVPIVFDPVTCAYDVQATYEDGSITVKRNVDLCSVRHMKFGR